MREQNRVLLAAGHAPAFAEHNLDDPALAPVRDAIEQILASHDHIPASRSIGAGTSSLPTERWLH